MVVVQTTSTAPAQGLRTVRAVSTWSPPSGQRYTRPWRSSPLARPAFSTLPPIIPESSEESLENDFDPPDSPREFEQTQRSPSSSSIQSDTPATSTSGYGSRNTSSSASALVLVEDEPSTSSISLQPSSSLHGNSQASSRRPARLLKSPGRRPSSAQARLSLSNVSETSITPLPRARTVSHGHSRSASSSPQPIAPFTTPTIPLAYSQNSPSPQPETNTLKQLPSTSRNPTANWMSSSPFGPAITPKFSRLAMASPAVVMPLSAKEYRMRKAKEVPGKDKEKEYPTSSNHITFIDSTISQSQTLNSVPLLTVSPPPSEQAPPSSGVHGLDLRTQPQPLADHPPPKPLTHASLSTQLQPQPSPSMAKHRRSRSRLNTSPRPSSLAAHPSISPKSSAGTFFSLVSTSSSDDDAPHPPPSHTRGADDSNTTNAIPPARPRPSRRKSYPDRLSNSGRFSLLEAMNRLSQESSSLHRLSALSQTDDANRLSVASQTSGHTLFYDVESDGDGRVVSGGQGGSGNGGGGQQRTSILATQSLEDLSSTLARTGIEVAHPDSDGDLRVPLNDERKGKRKVRKVRISDTVEVSSPSEPRRRKLTKSRPVSTRDSTPGTETMMATANEMKVQTTQSHERRMSLLPWKLKGSSSDCKSGAVSARSGAGVGAGEKRSEDGHPSTSIKGLAHPNEIIAPSPIPHSPALVTNGSTYVESLTQTESSDPIQKPFFTFPMSTTPRKTFRYSFPYLPSPVFHRSKREKSNTHSTGADPGPDRHTNTEGKSKESSVKGVESGADSTSTSIRTITQGSQSTLTPESPGLYDLTTAASSGWGTASPVVPMLRRLNAQEMAAGVSPQGERDGKGDSTPSLITNESTATLPSIPRTITLSSLVRQPSGLKDSFTDTIEEDGLEGMHAGEERGRTPRVRVHRKQDQRSSAHACGVEVSEEDEWVHLRRRSSSGLSMSMSPSPRPGTPSSTLTTATETSGSYISFSTIPTSTTSSSTSPSLMMSDKRDRMVSVPSVGGCKSGGGGGQVCTCGQLVPPSMSPTRERNRAEMHPMFTVPLVTVPASATPVAGADMGGDVRYVGRRKSERHLSVPVSAAVRVGVATARNGQAHHVIGGVPVSTVSAVGTTTSLSPSQSSAQKIKKHRRPQTAPPGTGDAASKFIEDTVMLRAREGHVGVGADHPMKHKVRSGSGESKFKTVLKGLLRWHG